MHEINQIINTYTKNLSKIFIIVFTGCLIVGVYTYFLAEKSYISESKLYVAGGSTTSSSLKAMALRYGVNLPGGGDTKSSLSSPELFVSLASSREALIDLLNSEFIIDSETTKLNLHLSKGKEKPDGALIKRLKNKIGIAYDRRSGIITLSISMNNPELAKDVNDRLINIINERFLAIKKLQTSAKKVFIEGRIFDLNNDLNDSEVAIKEFKELNRSISNSPELSLELNRLTRNNFVIEQMYVLLKEQLETTKIDEIENTTPLIIIDKPQIPFMKSSPSTSFNLIYTFILLNALSVIYFIRKEKNKN
tara:strand:+ start:10160 stop:11080 length:921 start_codon:yes stop_codon:yes gene_type:complete